MNYPPKPPPPPRPGPGPEPIREKDGSVAEGVLVALIPIVYGLSIFYALMKWGIL